LDANNQEEPVTTNSNKRKRFSEADTMAAAGAIADFYRDATPLETPKKLVLARWGIGFYAATRLEGAETEQWPEIIWDLLDIASTNVSGNDFEGSLINEYLDPRAQRKAWSDLHRAILEAITEVRRGGASAV
jgi:hypothetical protein